MTPTLRDILIDKFEYVIWADNEIMAAAATVPKEGIYRDQQISAGSIHKLLLHAMGGEAVWLYRWQGDSSQTFPTPEAFPTLAAIQERWKLLHGELMGFVRAQTEETLMRRVNYVRRGKPFSHPLWQVMMHCADHATYHRGQLNSMFKLAGGTPCDTSYVSLLRLRDEQGSGASR